MLNNNSSSINSHMNSFIFKLDREEDEFNIMEEKTPNNMSMFISSSYISSEIQEIHDGSNMKENEISEQFNNTNILGKKEALDKSMNFQNMSVEEEFIRKDDIANLGKETGIEPIKEREDDDEVNESFYHGDVNFIDEFEKRENLFVSKETSYFTDKSLPPIGRVAQQDRRKAGRSESVALESGLAN